MSKAVETVFESHPFVSIAVVAVSVIGFSFYRKYKRRQDLTDFAAANCLMFERNNVRRGEQLFNETGIEMFSRGFNGRAYNYMTGLNGAYSETEFFDYTYSSRKGGRNNIRYYYTCALLRNKAVNFPRFSLIPWNFFPKFLRRFGSKDIRLESSPALSDRYILKSSDVNSTKAFFSPSVIACFERNAGMNVYTGGNYMLVAVRGLINTQKKYPLFINAVRDFSDSLFSHARR